MAKVSFKCLHFLAVLVELRAPPTWRSLHTGLCKFTQIYDNLRGKTQRPQTLRSVFFTYLLKHYNFLTLPHWIVFDLFCCVTVKPSISQTMWISKWTKCFATHFEIKAKPLCKHVKGWDVIALQILTLKSCYKARRTPVYFAAVLWGKLCVTSQKTAAKTRRSPHSSVFLKVIWDFLRGESKPASLKTSILIDFN